MITFMSLMFAELYFAVVLCIDGLKLINELELELIFIIVLFFPSLLLKYLKVTRAGRELDGRLRYKKKSHVVAAFSCARRAIRVSRTN